MLMRMTAKLRGHETLIHRADSRQQILRWLIGNITEIETLEVDCNLNHWSWTPTIGWVQYPHNRQPKVRGNGYDAINPWRYCIFESSTAWEHDWLFPNPMFIVTPTF